MTKIPTGGGKGTTRDVNGELHLRGKSVNGQDSEIDGKFISKPSVQSSKASSEARKNVLNSKQNEVPKVQKIAMKDGTNEYYPLLDKLNEYELRDFLDEHQEDFDIDLFVFTGRDGGRAFEAGNMNSDYTICGVISYDDYDRVKDQYNVLDDTTNELKQMVRKYARIAKSEGDDGYKTDTYRLKKILESGALGVNTTKKATKELKEREAYWREMEKKYYGG
jgi:hypothetical protein